MTRRVPLKNLDNLSKISIKKICITSLSSMLVLRLELTRNRINKLTKPMKMELKRISLSRIKQVMCSSVKFGLLMPLSQISSTPRPQDGGPSGYQISTNRSHSMDYGKI
jgi:hypothetical protein